MITGFFLTIFYFFFTWLIGFIPDGGAFPTTWITGIFDIWYTMNTFSFIVPVSAMLTALAIGIALDLALLGWKFTLFTLQLFGKPVGTKK